MVKKIVRDSYTTMHDKQIRAPKSEIPLFIPHNIGFEVTYAQSNSFWPQHFPICPTLTSGLSHAIFFNQNNTVPAFITSQYMRPNNIGISNYQDA